MRGMEEQNQRLGYGNGLECLRGTLTSLAEALGLCKESSGERFER